MSDCPAVGIDLGTTYSVIARVDEFGRPVTLVNGEGEIATPSAVYFDGDDVVVGLEALKALATDGAQVAQCPKRQLGMRVFDKEIGGRRYPPEVLQALVLSRLRRDAESQMGPVGRAVVTVPAYFDEVRRKATQDAGHIAGLEVLDIINEPTAAAIAYGDRAGMLEADAPARRILVYDLGGGTFDVTVMEASAGEFATLATDGDVRLGGQDWNERLMQHLAERFEQEFGMDPRGDENAAGRLWRAAEEAKRTLTSRARAKIHFEHQGAALRMDVSRSEFEEMTRDLLERTAFTTRQTLLASGLEWEELDRVLLVGGSTRMPAVAEMLQAATGQAPDRSLSPDEAVAHGAALHAQRLLDLHAGRPPKFSIRNVNSHSLGVAAAASKTLVPRTAVVIPRNTPLPATAHRVFKTQKAGQTSILVRIVEGESLNPDDCSQIGRCVVRDLPPGLPAHTPIRVQFDYQENGRLSVTVAVEGADIALQHELERDHSLTREQLDLWRAYVAERGLV